jgi:hypothetical protein
MAITKVSSELIKDNSITMDKMHTGVVITTSEGLHNNANDTVLPTAGAVAAYVTSQVTGASNWDLSFAWGDHSTYGYATETYVNNSIANVINSAPATLDTLNELAAALGDDPNFATTVTNLIAGKQAAGTYNTIIGTDTDIDTSGATIVDNIYVTDGVITSMGTRTLTLADLGYTGATNANYITNNNQLTNGAGYITSFDITTQTDSKYLRSNANDTATGSLRFQNDLNYFGLSSGNNEGEIVINTGIVGSPQIGFTEHGDVSWAMGIDDSDNSFKFHGVASNAIPTINDLITPLFEISITAGTAYLNGNTVWHAGNDGSGSGLDADLLDGVQGSQFFRSDIGGTISSGVTISGNLTVGSGTSSYIDMLDSDHGTRSIHNNSNRIGFLTSSSAWGSYCSDNGDWTTDFISYAGASMRAPIFYDTNDTGYYLNPASTSNLNAVSAASVTTPVVTATEIYANNWFRNNGSNEGLYNQVTTQHWSSNTNGYWDASSTTSFSGIRLYTGGHVSALRGAVYANTSNEIGLLDSDLHWAIKHVRDSRTEFYINNSEVAEINADFLYHFSDIRSPIFYDSDNTGYYTNPASTSNLNALNVITLTETSALRFKENIKEDIDASIVDKLRPVSYDWKQTKEKDYGFIAEEVNELDEDLVTKNSDGEMSAIKYTKLIPFLVKKIQEQEKRIKQLENGKS